MPRCCASTDSAAGDEFYGKHNRLLTRYAQGAQRRRSGLPRGAERQADAQHSGGRVRRSRGLPRATAHVGRERMFTLTTFRRRTVVRTWTSAPSTTKAGRSGRPCYRIHLPRRPPAGERLRTSRRAHHQRPLVHGQGNRRPVRTSRAVQVSQAVAQGGAPRPVGDAEPAQWHRAAAPLAQRHRRPGCVRIVAASLLLQGARGIPAAPSHPWSRAIGRIAAPVWDWRWFAHSRTLRLQAHPRCGTMAEGVCAHEAVWCVRCRRGGVVRSVRGGVGLHHDDGLSARLHARPDALLRPDRDRERQLCAAH